MRTITFEHETEIVEDPFKGYGSMSPYAKEHQLTLEVTYRIHNETDIEVWDVTYPCGQALEDHLSDHLMEEITEACREHMHTADAMSQRAP